MDNKVAMPRIPFTRFMDMHSGGGSKTDYDKIYIQAPEAEAKIIFQERFDHDPDNITCDCCGDDFSIQEYPTLEEATGYDRGCKWEKGGYVEAPGDNHWNKYETLEAYISRADNLVIYSNGVEQ